MKRTVISCLFLLFVNLFDLCSEQIRPMGFTQKVITPNGSFHQYYPKLQIMNDTLFVSSNTGIYMKDLIHNSGWELYAFEGSPIVEFVRNGNELLANSMGDRNGQDRLLLFSDDNGKTCADYTTALFLENHGRGRLLFRITQNPQNPNSLLTLTAGEGVFKSKDFGKNWTSMYPYSLGYDIAFISYHPLDTAAIFYSGETPFMSGQIYSSYNSGVTWTSYEITGGDNCVHQIAFHPTNPDIMVFGGEGVFGKSTDKGKTWEIKNHWNDPNCLYFIKVLFDEENPDILYSSGYSSYSTRKDTIYVYRSTDMGDTWSLAYKEYSGVDCGIIIDMVKYKNKLIFYSRNCGLFELDVNTIPLSIQTTDIKPDVNIYPNPVRNTLYFNTKANVERIEIIDATGRIIQKTIVPENENAVNVSQLSKGIYFATFHTNGQKITKNLYIDN